MAADKFTIDIPPNCGQYMVGDFLRILDALSCFFMVELDMPNEQITDALEMYAKHIKEE